MMECFLTKSSVGNWPTSEGWNAYECSGAVGSILANSGTGKTDGFGRLRAS